MSKSHLIHLKAVVSIFTHLAKADGVFSKEELLVVLNYVHNFFAPHIDEGRLMDVTLQTIDEPYNLKEAIGIVKTANTDVALILMMASAGLIAVDQKVDMFEEAIFLATFKDILDLDDDITQLEELIAKMRRMVQHRQDEKENNQPPKSSGDEFEWL